MWRRCTIPHSWFMLYCMAMLGDLSDQLLEVGKKRIWICAKHLFRFDLLILVANRLCSRYPEFSAHALSEARVDMTNKLKLLTSPVGYSLGNLSNILSSGILPGIKYTYISDILSGMYSDILFELVLGTDSSVSVCVCVFRSVCAWGCACVCVCAWMCAGSPA